MHGRDRQRLAMRIAPIRPPQTKAAQDQRLADARLHGQDRSAQIAQDQPVLRAVIHEPGAEAQMRLAGIERERGIREALDFRQHHGVSVGCSKDMRGPPPTPRRSDGGVEQPDSTGQRGAAHAAAAGSGPDAASWRRASAARVSSWRISAA
jgi:hypothetical protein